MKTDGTLDYKRQLALLNILINTVLCTETLLPYTHALTLYSSTLSNIIQGPYPGITGCSLEGHGSMALYECESTTTTAVVQQHEWLLV